MPPTPHLADGGRLLLGGVGAGAAAGAPGGRECRGWKGGQLNEARCIGAQASSARLRRPALAGRGAREAFLLLPHRLDAPSLTCRSWASSRLPWSSRRWNSQRGIPSCRVRGKESPWSHLQAKSALNPKPCRSGIPRRRSRYLPAGTVPVHAAAVAAVLAAAVLQDVAGAEGDLAGVFGEGAGEKKLWEGRPASACCRGPCVQAAF